MSETAWLCCACLGACNDAEWVHRTLAVAVYPASKVVRFRGKCAMAPETAGERVCCNRLGPWGEMATAVALSCVHIGLGA